MQHIWWRPCFGTSEKTLATKATKADLERKKLEAELRKTLAEARIAELDLKAWQRDDATAEAAEHQNYIYNFIGQVGAKSCLECMNELGRWSRKSPKCAITIVFHSPGGSVLDGLALYDSIAALKDQGHHITTVVRGYAASMGSVLLQAGDKRVVGPRSWVMIHEVSSGNVGKVSDQEEDLQTTKRFQDQLAEILAERSTLSVEQLKRKFRKKDVWLNAEQSVELGLADEIG